jgi:hypothetical protein
MAADAHDKKGEVPMTIDMRSLSACVFACAVAMATAAPAESVLKSIDLNGMEAGLDAELAAEQGGIAQAFVKLGMEEKRAACYQEVLAQQLSPEEQQQAAEIIGQSTNADEVKANVVSAGPTIMGGFSAADVKCPEGMG